MGALFESQDLQSGFLPAGLRGSTHPGGVAADYDQSFFGHADLLESFFKHRIS
jgi:hypothetical protein